MSRPRCYNRPPLSDYATVPIGWTDDGRREMAYILDPMSKTCQQHGLMGEATLHPEQWACDGCQWQPKKETE